MLGAEPVRAELDRGTKVLLPNQAQKPISLPPDFFNVTPEELKREQELKYVCPFIMSNLSSVSNAMLLKTFLCRRDDIFGRYFGMILLYFGAQNCYDL